MNDVSHRFPSPIRTYKDALRHLLGLTARGIRPGLTRVRSALALVGEPHLCLPAVVVGGTNGKGSVSAIVAAAARAQGLKVGLFTSPHLHRLTERIQVGGREIGRRKLVEALDRVVAAVDVPGGPALTFFETLTVVAADVFARERVDLAVFEVGLGGRLDATRLVPARVVVLTGVALDHQQYLGDTLEAIATEKFALARRGSIVVAGALRPDLRDMLVRRAASVRAPLWLAGRDFAWSHRSGGTIDVTTPVDALARLRHRLVGAHQEHNAAVAVAALQALGRRGVPIGDAAIRRGLARVKWPARLERALGGRVVFDVAHNPDGVASLCAALPGLARGHRPIVAVLGCMRDKDVEGIVAPLARMVDHLLLAAPRMPRALPADQFPPHLGGRPMPSVEAAAEEALRIAGEHGLVVVAGSTFVVSEARAHLLRIRRVDPSVPM